MDLDLNFLRSFVVSAETGSFSETAKRRAIAQSAISMHIRKLEEATGQRLFDRSQGRSVTLTPEGEAFLDYALRILNLTDEALAFARGADTRTTLHLGTTALYALSFLPRVLEAYSRQHPEVDVQISCGRSASIMQRFDDGAFDVVFVTDQGRRSDRAFVADTTVSWTAGPGFETPPGVPLPLAFLPEGCDLRKAALNALDQASVKAVVLHSSPDPVGVVATVLSNRAITLLPTLSLTPQMKVLSGLPKAGSHAVAAYSRLTRPSRALRSFVACMCSEAFAATTL